MHAHVNKHTCMHTCTWSSESGWGDLMIWCKSVSISSYTTYTSLNMALFVGGIMSLICTMFSWNRCRTSLISRSVRLASITFSKALEIFFMATFSLAWRFRAELNSHSSGKQEESLKALSCGKWFESPSFWRLWAQSWQPGFLYIRHSPDYSICTFSNWLNREIFCGAFKERATHL
jgi:hypothetical protein